MVVNAIRCVVYCFWVVVVEVVVLVAVVSNLMFP